MNTRQMDIRPQRILFESTCTFGTRFTTGIQRVVRNVIWEADVLAPGLGVQCVPVVLRNGRFYDATPAWRRKRRRQARCGLQPLRLVARTIDGLSPRAARLYTSALVRLRKLLYPKTIVRTMANACWEVWGEQVSFRETDVLLLLDESWSLPVWPAVQEARQRGCRVGAVVYDLIPMDYPQLFEDKFAARFGNWVDSLVDHADFFLAISNMVAERLQAYIGSGLRDKQGSAKPIVSFPLGAEIADLGVGGAVQSRVRSLFQGNAAQAPYLSVGTIEPRKNHHYLLDAFDVVWRRYPEVKLCIVGRVGWKCRDVVARIESHSQFGKSLFLFNDLTDPELHCCYREAKALVSSSVAEGFGLPIVEGLRYGLRVLASDIPIHREVGGYSCAYFDLARPESLARLVLDMEQRGDLRFGRRPERFATTTWTESCREVLSKALHLAAASMTEQGAVVGGLSL